MQYPDFDEEAGRREFSLDDRRKVKDVFDRVLDEMGDAHELKGMFVPYANIVHKILTDGDIAQQIQDEAHDFMLELQDLDNPDEE